MQIIFKIYLIALKLQKPFAGVAYSIIVLINESRERDLVVKMGLEFRYITQVAYPLLMGHV